MPDPSAPAKKSSIKLDRYVNRKATQAIQKLSDEVKQDRRDLNAISEFRLKQISPKNAKRIGDAVQDAMIDRYGPSAKGYSVPVDLFLDLPDQSRLKVNVDPNTRSFSVMFGMRW